MPGKLIANELDLVPDQLQELQPLLWGREQVVELNDGMVKLARNLANISHGQLICPAPECFGRGVAKRQAGCFLFWDSKIRFQIHAFHEFTPLLRVTVGFLK